jgi:DNA-binding response OmpR family regulator
MILRSTLLVIDLPRRLAWTASESTSLTAAEFDILSYLMRNSDRVVPKSEMLREVFGIHHANTTVMSVHLCHLRRKLGLAGKPIITVRGRGFRFAAPVDVDSH